MSAPFTHLHVHTQYSLLDGASRITELVERARALGQTSLAITDHGVMYGVIDFYKACVKAGIKPILGMEAYVAPRSRFDKSGAADRDNAHLILLCKNETGYRNLTKLDSEAFLHGFYYRPRIDYDLLEQHHEGLICLSACLAGDIPQLLMQGRYDDALAMARRLQGMFGEDFYIELQNHGLPDQIRILPDLVRIAETIGAKTVATNDIHYVTRADSEAQDILLCIQTQRYVDETDRMRMGADQFYLKSREEMEQAFPDHPEALDNTQEIADKCNVTIEFGVRRLPAFTAPDGMTNPAYLRQLCYEGLARKLPSSGEDARERLEYELGVIEKMGFVDYFLIVWDFIHFAKTHGIMVGPGRGSGAGSLAAYCMDITDVDPLRYSLLFERFLNPERVSMPDFDIDFCYERRQEVIDYVGRKYGDGHVCQIITFGTMAARAVIRDVGRVMRIPYADIDRLAKLVPRELNITLDRAIALNPELKNLYETDPTVTKILDLSKKLEGLPRHSSTHAAGVVISGVPITDVVPLQMNDDVITTQFAAPTLEELGLLKMDFLGLRTLTVIRDALHFIEQGGKKLPEGALTEFNDPEVYRMISAGDTDGVFQLESAGMRQFITQLRPDCFEDIIAGISLFRPGPMEQIPRYLRGKHDPASVTYAHPLLKPILENSYGCMVYQEQVMEIVRTLAGYSFGRSDLVRRAMAKKKHDVMAKEREYFVNGTEGVRGAVANGVPADVANRIFDEMMDFASYAFNKSHAACYAVLAYRTAYLKRYYPVEFLTAMMNSFIGSVDKVSEYVFSAKRSGITLLPPDINKSTVRFSVEDGCIRFGLAAVRNVGESAMREMVSERDRNGPFRSFFDFTDRTPSLNKRMLESLIFAGCFDRFGIRRSCLYAIHDKALDASASAKKTRETGQLSLFDAGVTDVGIERPSIAVPNMDEWPEPLLLAREKESTGLYLSGHPLDQYASYLTSLKCSVLDLQEADGTSGIPDDALVTVGGLLSQCKQKPTKSGNGLMGYGTLEGLAGSVELVLFPRTLTACAHQFTDDAAVEITGRLNIRDDRANSLLVERLISLEEAVQASRKLYLRFPIVGKEQLDAVREMLADSPGSTPVILFDAAKRIGKAAPRELSVTCSDAFLERLRAAFGAENVVLK